MRTDLTEEQGARGIDVWRGDGTRLHRALGPDIDLSRDGANTFSGSTTAAGCRHRGQGK
jgi:hypothetical protein